MKTPATLMTLLLMCALTLPAAAQKTEKHHGNRPHPSVTEVVSDLSSRQKQSLDELTANSRKTMDRLRHEQKAVRDSIHRLMDQEGDQTTALFPLFDREAQLQAEMSREMYATRIKIDKILTPEQRAEMRKACTPKQREHQPGKRSSDAKR